MNTKKKLVILILGFVAVIGGIFFWYRDANKVEILPETGSSEGELVSPVNVPYINHGWREWYAGVEHNGVDLIYPDGDGNAYGKVYSAGVGNVVFAGWDNTGYGNLIIIRHRNNLYTAYAHLSAIYISGGGVDKNSHIGNVGDTGNTSGPHLHFELRDCEDPNSNDIFKCRKNPTTVAMRDRGSSGNPTNTPAPPGGKYSCGECGCQNQSECKSGYRCDFGQVSTNGCDSRCILYIAGREYPGDCSSFSEVGGADHCECKQPSNDPTSTPRATNTPVPVDKPAKGTHENLTCAVTTGWACDPDSYSTKIKVKLYRNDPAYPNDASKKKLLVTTTANNNTGNGDCGGTANHQFTYTVPEWILSQYGGDNIKIWAYAINIGNGSEHIMTNSPRVIDTSSCINTPTNTPVITQTPTSTPIATVTLTPTPNYANAINCGALDVYNTNGQAVGDNYIDLNDFIKFRQAYNKVCNDDTANYGVCGGKNRRYDGDDHVVDLNDFIYFSKVYMRENCSRYGDFTTLPETGASTKELNYIAIILLEIVVSISILFGTYNYKKYKDE